jgi:hypothetical protein
MREHAHIASGRMERGGASQTITDSTGDDGKAPSMMANGPSRAGNCISVVEKAAVGGACVAACVIAAE